MSVSKEGKIGRLILGTAQFGLDYGISNQQGQLKGQKARAILAEAGRAGILTLDTAAAYGESESCLGNALEEQYEQHFRIISKYPPSTPEISIRQAVEASLIKLKADKLHGYLLHSYGTYAANKAVLRELKELKAGGLVEKIGISLYHQEEAEQLLQDKAAIDIVQFPYSVFDQRFERVMPQLRQHGIATHVRSVYLQGLFFMPPGKLPKGLHLAALKVKALQQLAEQQEMPLGALLLNFALSNQNISNVVIGVESLETLQENISYCGISLNQELLAVLRGFTEADENIILPYKWPKK